MTHKVCFKDLIHQKQVDIEANHDEKLTQVAFRAQMTIQQTCAGKATCTDCRVRISDGLWTDLGTPTEAEKRALGNVFHISKIRLACQARVVGSCTVEILGPQKRLSK